MSKTTGRKVPPISLSLPEKMRMALDESARKNGRSRNSEALLLLGQSLGIDPFSAEAVRSNAAQGG